MTTYAITAEHADDGATQTLARSTNLDRLAKRIEDDAELWDSLGWEGLQVESVRLGYQLSAEELRGMYLRDEITPDTYSMLRPLTLR